MSDAMDVENVHSTLGRAIDMQARSVLTMALVAGTLRGIEATAIKQSLREFVLAELEDTYQLIEKFSALGGQPTMDPPKVSVSSEARQALQDLLEVEAQGVAALHAVIPHSGQEPRSEALEHLLEHIIMRKQQQIDFLWHASNQEEPLA